MVDETLVSSPNEPLSLSLDFDMLKQLLWLIRVELDQYVRKALINEYMRVC